MIKIKSRKVYYTLVCLFCLFTLNACGNKKDLYYPTQSELKEIEARKARIKERKEAKKKASPNSSTSNSETSIQSN